MGLPKKVQKLFLLAHDRLRRNKHKVFLFGSILFSWAVISLGLIGFFKHNSHNEILGITSSSIQSTRISLVSPLAETANTPTPTVTHPPTPTLPPLTIPKKKKPLSITISPTTKVRAQKNMDSQYTAEKINDVTWRVKDVVNDDRMATADEIVNALNSYRGNLGRSNLSVDGNLSAYASERANLFASNSSLDSHAGFRSYMDNGGFEKSGFNSLGENSAYASGPMEASKIIKNLFGADSSHDSNQLDNWTHVGVGVNGLAINVNFGKNKK